MTFVHRQFEACLLNAFESCSEGGDVMISIIGCLAAVVHVLDTLIHVKNFAEILFHETRKCRQRPGKALCQASVSKCAASEIEGQLLN